MLYLNNLLTYIIAAYFEQVFTCLRISFHQMHDKLQFLSCKYLCLTLRKRGGALPTPPVIITYDASVQACNIDW